MKTENDIKTSSSFVRYGAIIGLVSPIIWILLVILMSSLHDNYSHLTNFISELGAIEAPNPFVQRINFFQFGFSILVLAVALYKGMARPSIIVLVFQIIIGLGIFLSGIFPGNITDPKSYSSMMHDLVGLPAFLLIILIPLITGWKFRNRESWKDLAPYSMLMTPVLLLMLYLMIRADTVVQNGFPGLYQRIFLGIWIIWMILVSLRLKKLESKKTNR